MKILGSQAMRRMWRRRRRAKRPGQRKRASPARFNLFRKFPMRI